MGFSHHIFSSCSFFLLCMRSGRIYIMPFILFAAKRTQFFCNFDFHENGLQIHIHTISDCSEIITAVQCNYFNCQFTQKHG